MSMPCIMCAAVQDIFSFDSPRHVSLNFSSACLQYGTRKKNFIFFFMTLYHHGSWILCMTRAYMGTLDLDEPTSSNFIFACSLTYLGL